jgi:glutathione synthase/RimK-type ligase-like ATP-grasp enzyme
MPDLYFATCASIPELTADDQRLLRAVRACGVDARPGVWSDGTVPWSAARVCVLRNTWDYYQHLPAFLSWLQTTPVRFRNPLEIVTWNINKRYLRELHSAGVPIVDTIWVGQEGEFDLEGSLEARGWDEFIIKPVVGASAYRTLRAKRGGTMAEAEKHLRETRAHSAVMIQPFIESVLTEGELSLIFFNGTFSHAVRKVPKSGDFRVQDEYGGSIDAMAPDAEALAAAQRCMEQVDTMYARVDLVRAADDTWRLIELELVEPALYLEWGEGAAERFADIIVAELHEPAAHDRG